MAHLLDLGGVGARWTPCGAHRYSLTSHRAAGLGLSSMTMT